MDEHTALGIAGGVLSAIFGGVIIWGRARRVKVPVVAVWPRIPTVGVEPGSVEPAIVEKAVAWWQRRGWDIGPVRLGTGDITIRDWNPARFNGDDPHGWCGLDLTADGDEIVSADVMVAKPKLVHVVHELGHALGLMHPNMCPTGHPMHPREPGLRDTRGLEAP